MYALPNFDNGKTSNSTHQNSVAGFHYPPPSSSPFLTLGSGFFEKPFARTSHFEPSPKQTSYSNTSPGFVAQKFERRHFSRDQNQNKRRFPCDSCNRSFLFQSDLDKHVAQHIKQNCSGLAVMIAKLSTPEEIRKWREERRKNFPTAANIKKKKEEEAARRARGEVLDTGFRKNRRKYGKNPKYGSHQNNGKETFTRWRRHRKRKSKNSANSSEFRQEQTNKACGRSKEIFDTFSEAKDGLVKFCGTICLEESKTSKRNNDSVLTFNQSPENDKADMKKNTSNCISDSKAEDKNGYVISDSEVEDKKDYVISDSEVEDMHNVATYSVLPITAPSLDKPLNKLTNQLKAGTCETEISYVGSCHENSAVVSGEKSGLSFFTADKEIEDSDDEVLPSSSIVENKPVDDSSLHMKVGGALGNLMAAYDTESEQECKDGHVSELLKEKPSASIPPVKNEKRRPYVSRRKLTLLEKLLASEIRHERNVIFQCINYVVNKNFFDE